MAGQKPTSTKEDILKLMPALYCTVSGRVDRLEHFSHYVARQMGLEDPNECPMLCKLANEYLRKTEGCESAIFEFLASDADAKGVYVMLIEELEMCILAYFAFHWSHSSHMISQVLSGDESDKKAKLKDFFMAATRLAMHHIM